MASKWLTRVNVKARIETLRALEKAETREIARMTKAVKLQNLEAIIISKRERTLDRINAIRAHNDMTGDNEPTQMVVETGANTLASIKERAAQVRGGLSRVQNPVK